MCLVMETQLMLCMLGRMPALRVTMHDTAVAARNCVLLYSYSAVFQVSSECSTQTPGRMAAAAPQLLQVQCCCQ
jgi:hypothetical protein